MSPPWGGPHYIRNEVYDADKSLAAFGGLRGLTTAALSAVRVPALTAKKHSFDRRSTGVTAPDVPSDAGITSAVALAPPFEPLQADTMQQLPLSCQRGIAVFLPRQTDLQQLSAAAPDSVTVEVERAVLDGFVKGITVYVWLNDS